MSNTRSLVVGALALALAACGGGEKKSIEDQIGPASKKMSDVKAEKKSTMSPEELAEARKKAGFVDPEEEKAKVAAEMEKGEREFVKTRLKEFRDLNQDFGAKIDELDKGVEKFAKAKDPEKAFAKFKEKFMKPARALMKTQAKLTENNARGGRTNELLIMGLRTWDDLLNDLSADIADNERYPEIMKELREQQAKVTEALDDIDKDEDLVVNKFYKPGEEGAPAGEEAE
ncbi:MAG: hypothetical protein R3A79_14945 [Nannocystaceae bacterium]